MRLIMRNAHGCLSRAYLAAGWLEPAGDALSPRGGGEAARARLPDGAVMFPCVGKFVIRLLLKPKKKKHKQNLFPPVFPHL